MADIDLNGDSSELGPIDDPEQGRVLAERLRLAAELLHDEFQELSKPEAERLIFQAAQEVLSAASVVQFVPTFAERRARHILHGGLPSAADPSLDLTTSESQRHDGEEPVGAPDTPNAGPSIPPRWPDAFYATEAKRLLEKARLLRASALAADSRD